MSDSAFSEGTSTREGTAGRTGSTPMLGPASAGSWGDLRSSQESAPQQGVGTPTMGSPADLTSSQGDVLSPNATSPDQRMYKGVG